MLIAVQQATAGLSSALDGLAKTLVAVPLRRACASLKKKETQAATLQKELVLNPHFRQVVEERVARVCAPRCELQDAAKIQPGPKVVPLPDPSPPYYVFVVALVLLLLLWRRLKADRV